MMQALLFLVWLNTVKDFPFEFFFSLSLLFLKENGQIETSNNDWQR